MSLIYCEEQVPTPDGPKLYLLDFDKSNHLYILSITSAAGSGSYSLSMLGLLGMMGPSRSNSWTVSYNSTVILSEIFVSVEQYL